MTEKKGQKAPHYNTEAGVLNQKRIKGISGSFGRQGVSVEESEETVGYKICQKQQQEHKACDEKIDSDGIETFHFFLFHKLLLFSFKHAW